MKIPQRIRKLARRGRAVFRPMGSVDRHLSGLVLRTGRELGFCQLALQNLETEVKDMLKESGLKQ